MNRCGQQQAEGEGGVGDHGGDGVRRSGGSGPGSRFITTHVSGFLPGWNFLKYRLINLSTGVRGSCAMLCEKDRAHYQLLIKYFSLIFQ